MRTQTTRTVSMVAALLIAVMSFQLNATMLAPAIRGIETELGAGTYAAMSTYFYLAGAVANVVLVRWSDFVGRRLVLVAVLGVLCVGNALCTFGSALPLVLTGRVLQGVSNVTFGLALLIMRERLGTKAFGTASGLVAAMAGGVAGGDGILGGYLSDHFGYQSIFAFVGVIGVVAGALCAVAVPADDRRRGAPGRMDWTGAALIGLGVAGLNLFSSAAANSGWGSPTAVGFVVAAMVALAALVVVERRRRHPLVDVDQLRSRQAWPLVVVTILNMASLNIVLSFVVPYLAEDRDSGFGQDGLTTSLWFIAPAAIGQLLVAPLAGRLGVRIGYVPVLRIGQVCGLVTVVLLAVAAHDATMLAIMVAVLGLTFMGMAMTATSILGVVQAPEDEPGALPGISSAAYGIGASLGFAWAGPVVGSGTTSSFALALWISVGIGGVALAASLLLVPRPAQLATQGGRGRGSGRSTGRPPPSS